MPRNCMVTLALAALAVVGNYFAFNLFQGIDFLFGSIAAFVALRLYGIRSGCFVAFIGSIVTYYDWGHPYAIIIFTLEVAVVGLVTRRIENLVLADAIYWLLLGVGGVTLFYSVFLGTSLESAVYIALKQSVNGMLNAVIAAFLLEVGRFYIPTVRHRLPAIPLRTLLFYFVAVIVMGSSTAFVLVQSRSAYNRAVSGVNTAMTLLAFWADHELKQTDGNVEQLRREFDNRVSPVLSSLSKINFPISAVSIGIVYPDGQVSSVTGDLRSTSQDGRVVIGESGVYQWEPAGEMPNMLRAREMVYLVRKDSLLAPTAREIVVEISAVPLTKLMESAGRRALGILALILLAILSLSRALTHGLTSPTRQFLKISEGLLENIKQGRPPPKFSSTGIIEWDSVGALVGRISLQLADSFREQKDLNATLDYRVKQRTQELELLSQVAKQTTNAVIVTDTEGKVTWVNNACTELSGYSLSELRGKTLGETLQKVPPPPEIREDMCYAISKVQGFHHEIINHTKHGTPYWVEIHSNPMFDAKGNHTGFISIENDITRRREAEFALEDSLAQLRLATSIANIGVWTYDNTDKALEWNDKNYELHGIPQTVYNKYEVWESAVHQDDLEAMRHLLRNAKEDRDHVVEFEYRFTHPELGERIISSRVQVVSVKTDGTRSYIGTNLDITESRKSKERLEQAAAKLAAILNNALDSIITTDKSGKITSFNSAAQKMFGYSVDEAVGRDVAMLMPNSEAKHHPGHIFSYLNGRDARMIDRVTEVIALRANGEEFPVELSVSKTMDDSGIIFIGIARDLTERNKIDRMKSEFVATVSHELRTPLTSISGALALLRGGAAGEIPEKGHKLLDTAMRNSQRLTRLIEDLLDIERLTFDRMNFDFEVYPIDTLLKQALESNDQYAGRKNISLELKEPVPDVSIRVDEGRFVQILSNFISNAVKFSPQGERVCVDVTLDGDDMICTVTDSGPGIPDTFRERLFQKFAQVDSSDSRNTDGTGLGLAISKELAINMNGSVGYETARDGGAQFWVRFPVVGNFSEKT